MIVRGWTFAEAEDTLRQKLLTSYANGDHQASSTTSGAGLVVLGETHL